MNTSADTRSYTVTGMYCGHYVAAVTKEVAAVPGVGEVDVDLDTKLVVVRGAVLDDDAIRAAICKAGYEALA